MSKLIIEVPDSLQKKASHLAEQDGISLERFVEDAISAKVTAAEMRVHLAERVERGNRAKFDAVLAKVSDSTPDTEDQL